MQELSLSSRPHQQRLLGQHLKSCWNMQWDVLFRGAQDCIPAQAGHRAAPKPFIIVIPVQKNYLFWLVFWEIRRGLMDQLEMQRDSVC